ncbi:MAG: hypothetical protein ACYSTY_07485, partial [Planctomycetota bacterium]
MNARHVTLTLLIGTAVCGLPVGCGEADYGWFTYAAPKGWARYVPPEGITLAPNVIEFYPDVEDLRDVPRLEIREVTNERSRSDRVAALYARAREREWRFLCAEAERRGDRLPKFKCDSFVHGPMQAEALSILVERDGKVSRKLVCFIESSDGRRFRAEYAGVDPAFTVHRSVITASLETLSFPAPESGASPLSLEE